MGKRIKRWPMWKLVVATIGSFVAGGLLFWLSVLAERAAGEPLASEPAASMNLPMVIMALGLAMIIVGIIGLIRLGLRVNEARKPPWERGKKGRYYGR